MMPEGLAEKIRRAAHLLPAQGPIGVFIHHNTLHAFEREPFDKAVRMGARTFGCQPFLSEDRYREELARGRILSSDLGAVLRRSLGARAEETVLGLSRRLDLRMAMLEHPLQDGAGSELDWYMAETDALARMRRDVSEVQRRRLVTGTRHWVMRRLRGALPGVERPRWAGGLLARFQGARIEDWGDDRWEAFTVCALWEICGDGVGMAPDRAPERRPPVRHRDAIRALGGADSDLLVNDALIPFCAAFLDQGVSHWQLPERDRGLMHSFCSLHSRSGRASGWWLAGLGEEAERLLREGLSPLACIQESLDALGVSPEETEDFLRETLLALRGWAGMLWHIEERPDRAHHPIPNGSLVDFLAVRLLLDRLALRAAARESLGYEGGLATMRAELARRLPAPPLRDKQRAFLVFQLAQVLGWTPERLFHLSPEAWRSLLDELESFDEMDRRQAFHLAYEHRFRARTLNALASRSRRTPEPPARPVFQAVFCLDEREESIRRHAEEAEPAAETFGAAGFFGVAMYYRGAAAADFVPLCPVVVRPRHWVSETVDGRLLEEERRRRRLRQRIGGALQGLHGGGRGAVSGALLPAALGLLATVPLVARVVFPRLTARLRGYLGSFLVPPQSTRLSLERAAPDASADASGQGFLLSEMVEIGERLLRDIGLTSNFSRLVLLIGHGSTSLNNPHESAHDCGACGGGAGGPNARAAAQMLNDPRARAALKERGIDIPSGTAFVGGMHNTANDDLDFFDEDRIPASHEAEFEEARRALYAACVRNAHERSRRFGSASLDLTAPAAKRHVEARAEDLAQVRPEWGHATNAVCIVGRRRMTRGLFLDRRAFLVSYDPAQDDEASAVLTRILGAVVPVCSGINLEYYFSYVDPAGWGSGTKLPHNITGLLGVMDGALSDLRTGLPWQMVEIHEPVRLLFVIEAAPSALLGIMGKNQAIRTLVENSWVQLASMDPSSGALSVYQDGAFEPYTTEGEPLPAAASSQEWYSGWRDHLEFAQISERPSYSGGVHHAKAD